MHDHTKDGGGKGMLWMMIPCLLLLGVLFLGGGAVSGSGYLWPILIGIFVVAHVWMMFRGHGKHRDTNTGENIDPSAEASMHTGASAQTGSASAKSEVKGGHTHGGCCH